MIYLVLDLVRRMLVLEFSKKKKKGGIWAKVWMPVELKWCGVGAKEKNGKKGHQEECHESY